jgi:hypothetical protein
MHLAFAIEAQANEIKLGVRQHVMAGEAIRDRLGVKLGKQAFLLQVREIVGLLGGY